MQRLSYDTNVCGKLESGQYSAHLPEIKRRVSRKYRQVVSPNTFVELLDALKDSKEEYFEAHKSRLRLMAGERTPKFLRFPIAFAMKHVLGLDAPGVRLGPKEFEHWYRTTLRAKNREQLFSGDVKHPMSSRKRYGFDPDVIRAQQEEGKKRHREFMEKASRGKASLPPPEIWAATLAESVGCKLTRQQAIKLASRLGAAYEYEKELFRLALSGKYNLSKHDTDWIDFQQLFYLCDEGLVLVTDDGGLEKRTRASSQNQRIILLPDFLNGIGVKALKAER